MDLQAATPPGAKPRKLWTKPELAALPKLTELTLVTGAPIPGEGDGGGGTVF